MDKTLYQTNATDDIVVLTDTGIENVKSSDNTYSDDTKPIAPEERNWSAWNTATLWIGITVSVAGYQLASSLIVSGMTWYQALFTILLGHSLVMIPAVMLGHFGTKFGLNYTMLSKMMFGLKGSIIPALIRSAVGIFWFGVQSWIGGQALNSIIGAIFPSWHDLGQTGLFISFIIFWLINLYTALSGSKGVKLLQAYAAPVLIGLSVVVIIWAISVADGSLTTLMSQPVLHSGEGKFGVLFLPALSAMIAYDGGPAMSMSDFTRYNKSQKSQILGQVISAPLTAAYIAFVGICGTAASNIAFGEPVWEPAILVSKFSNPIVVIVFSIFIIGAVLTTNVAGNLMPASLAFSTLFPKKINYKWGVIIASVLGLITMPWYTMANPDSFINVFLGGLGALMGPITGLFIASYWFEHKREANIAELYKTNSGTYNYKNGWNLLMSTIFLVFTVLVVLGRFWAPLSFLYNNSYVLGGGLAGLSYYIINQFIRKKQ